MQNADLLGIVTTVPAATSSIVLYRRLLSYVWPHRRVFLLAILGMVLLASTEWILPAFMKRLVDDEFGRAVGRLSLVVPLLMIALFALRGLLSYVSTVGLHWVSHRMVADLRNAMFATLVALPATYFDRYGSGSLLSKFTFDVTQVAQASTRVLTVLIKDSVVIVVLLCYVFYLNWRLSVLLLLLAPPIAFVMQRVSRRMRDMSRRLQIAVGDINQVTEEAIGGHREIKIYAGKDYEAQRFESANKNTRQFQMKVVGAAAATEPVIQMFVAFGIACMVVLALREASLGSMTRGDFVSFVTATALLLPPVKRLTGVNEWLQRGIAAAESVFALIDAPRELDSGTRELDPVRGEVVFADVCLSYDRTTVLNDINLRIDAGESVAFVGSSGGGKTSLVHLVPRFYLASHGEIYLDGVPISELSLATLRRAIAYVGQHVVLFNDTIYNNIAYGALRHNPAEAVHKAAVAAHVVEFVNQFPQGFDTVVGENGVRLSGGQRQRIAIARALLKNAPVLILDEATSALDSASEQHIQQALQTVQEGRTCLIVAHRLSTIETCDRIVVLEDGRIVELGTHRELLATRGVYAKLYATQYRA